MTDANQVTDVLHDLHQQAQAEFQPYGAIEIVATFGQPTAEYAAIRTCAGLMDLPQRGVLEVTGADRLDFLNRFLTNQTYDKSMKTPMPTGSMVYAFLLDSKGRIVADMNVVELGDRTLLETDARNIPALKKTLDRYVFSEKITFTSAKLHVLALHGPKAAEIVADDATIKFRDDVTGVPGFFLLCPVDQAVPRWQSLAGRPGVCPIGWAAFNAARIEAGRTLMGIDFDERFLPAETGQLQRAVSFTKGCYLGQEIVARMKSRDQVARQVVGIRMLDDALPIAGAVVLDMQQNTVGGVTSSTVSPVLSNLAICLAVMKRPFHQTGSAVMIAAEGTLRKGTVVDLPFFHPAATADHGQTHFD